MKTVNKVMDMCVNIVLECAKEFETNDFMEDFLSDIELVIDDKYNSIEKYAGVNMVIGRFIEESSLEDRKTQKVFNSFLKKIDDRLDKEVYYLIEG